MYNTIYISDRMDTNEDVSGMKTNILVAFLSQNILTNKHIIRTTGKTAPDKSETNRYNEHMYSYDTFTEGIKEAQL